MSKTLTTPHLVFKPPAIQPEASEQVACDEHSAQDVARPLFE